MRELDALREEYRDQALRNLGLSADVDRTFAPQVRRAGEEAKLARLPVDTSQSGILQPVGGAPFMFVGIDDVGSDALIGP